MPPTDWSYSALRETIHRYIDILAEWCPDSVVVSWWQTCGDDLTWPDITHPIHQDHLHYLITVLDDAVATRDIPDLEYTVTRLMSDVLDLRDSITD